MTVHIFAYGTLTIPEVMRAVTGQCFHSAKAHLPGYERYCLVDKIYPGIIHTGQKFTTGKIYFDVDEQSLQRLDYFEDELYSRQGVTVVLPDHAVMNAYAYIVPSTQIKQVSKHIWSEKQFRISYLTGFLTQVHQWMSEYERQT